MRYVGVMNVAVRPTMTLDQFLPWEERQELRHEFDGVRPVAMTGGTAAHAFIERRLISALDRLLSGTPCQPYGSNLKVQVAGRIRYPDAFVVCTPVPPRAKVVTEPVVVFEVLSASTMNEDLVVKNAEYRATPSIRRYVVLQQTHRGAVAFSRKADDWTAEIVPDGGTLDLPEIGVSLPLAELYDGLDLSDAAEEPAPG